MQNHSSLIELIVTEDHLSEHKRLDTLLAKRLNDRSRSQIKKMFEDGLITSNAKIELKKLPPVGTKILIKIPEVRDTDIIAQDIPLKILYEDEFLIIIDKQAGLVVHPAAGNPDGTLVNAILHHCPDLKGIGDEKRPGIVHRLDKGTTGIMVIAKEQKTHQGLVDLFSKHDLKRQYQAILLGNKMDPSGSIESLISRSPHNRLKMTSNTSHGKKAITHYKVLEYGEHLSHVEFTLHTGRTHQIRVHSLEHLNAPIISDKLYGREKEESLKLSSIQKKILKDYEHPLLHAKVLSFIHPITKRELDFQTDPPRPFKDILEEWN